MAHNVVTRTATETPGMHSTAMRWRRVALGNPLPTPRGSPTTSPTMARPERKATPTKFNLQPQLVPINGSQRHAERHRDTQPAGDDRERTPTLVPRGNRRGHRV